MRKLLFSILCCFSLIASAQTDSNSTKDEVLKDKFPTYQGIINIEGKNSNVIYSSIKAWVAIVFNSANDVIQLDDKENGKLIVKGLSSFSYKVMGANIGSKCFYTLTIDTKDNRFRYTIDMTEVEVGSKNQSAYKMLIEKPDKGQAKDILKEVEAIKNKLVNNMKSSVIQDAESGDW